MQSESTLIIRAFLNDREVAKKKLEEAKTSRIIWVVWTLLIGFVVAAWLSGNQARDAYARGFKDGVMSTEEGRLASSREAASHISCNTNGRNCVSK